MSFSNNYNYYKHKIKKKVFHAHIKEFWLQCKIFCQEIHNNNYNNINSEKLQYFQETKKQLPSGMYCLKSKKKKQTNYFLQLCSVMVDKIINRPWK